MMLLTNRTKWTGLAVGAVMLLICMIGSIVLGYTRTDLSTFINAFIHFDNSTEHLVIVTQRFPRAMIGAAVGASLGISGALLQALTRNPLADSKILGINAGAAFVIVLAVSLFSVSSMISFVWLAFAGASLSSLIVYGLGTLGRGGMTPMKYTLAGAAVWALFSSVTQGLLVLNERALEEVLFWLAGSVQGRSLAYLQIVLPYLTVGWIGAIALTRHINVFMIGEDAAKGLGQRTGTLKFAMAAVIMLLAGGSVAIAGPIGFLGIMVPHVGRWLVGNDYRWLVPYSGLLGGILLILADIAARFVIMPQEVPVGIMTAIIGAPFFIHIARRERIKI